MRRLIHILLIACFFSFASGLLHWVHARAECAGHCREHDGQHDDERDGEHDARHCQVCQTLAATRAVTPDPPQLAVFMWETSGRAIAMPAQTLSVRDLAGEPKAPRAPPFV